MSITTEFSRKISAEYLKMLNAEMSSLIQTYLSENRPLIKRYYEMKIHLRKTISAEITLTYMYM